MARTMGKPAKATKATKAPTRRLAIVKRSAGRKQPSPAKRATPRVARESAAPLDEADAELREIFDTYDRDGSGRIDRSELARVLEALGVNPTEEELEFAFEVVDADGSGQITWAEFQAWWLSR